MKRRLDLFCVCIQLFFVHHASLPDLAHHCTLMTHSFNNVARSSLTLCPDERRPF
jgi:hypothetical protein